MGDTNLLGKSCVSVSLLDLLYKQYDVAEAFAGIRLTYRIIVTVLTGFLNVGRLTSITVFIYVLLANAFFLVSRPFPHFRLLSPSIK
jgi:hypothetical protein